MSRLVVLMFGDQGKIDEAVRVVRKLRSQRDIKFYASAVASKTADGKSSVQQITKGSHGGAVVGGLIGAVAGAPAGPVAAAITAAGGAAIGEAADLSAEDGFEKAVGNIAQKLTLGDVAIVAEVAEESAAAFEAVMQKLGGRLLVQ